MSTFNGLVEEFPNIRIDYFRHHPTRPPPQACFLSHVHSDHLQGLESLKMPFVYCSAATKKILLRMERYPHRINFAKGILEARKQTYKPLKLILRPLPLETSVELEVGPKTKIRVTLFDANHCPGAVMFLIEGDGRAILYTGDIRAESWWVNSIVRNPILLPYSCGTRKLDCIYLDTTFASRDDIYEVFPTKSEGIQELLTKISKCPSNSIFYFRSWTLGYEDVWIALSNFLRSPVHVDDYQLRLFRSLSEDVVTDRGAALAGFNHGNQRQSGCLTADETVSIHSCEPGTKCHDKIKKQKDVVWITPIISRLKNGTEIAELGAGGGGGDLYQTPELELIDEAALKVLEELCTSDTRHKEAFEQLKQTLSDARAKGSSNINLDGLGLYQDEEVSIKEFLRLISVRDEVTRRKTGLSDGRIIHFPYSRHSSFSELRHLVSSFQPRDICPCTVDVDTWLDDISVEALFGDLCSEKLFQHDKKTRIKVQERSAYTSKKRKRRDMQDDSQETATRSSAETEEAYRSAKTSMRKGGEDELPGQIQQEQPQVESLSNKTPTPVSNLRTVISDRFEVKPDHVRHVTGSEPHEAAHVSRTIQHSDQPGPGSNFLDTDHDTSKSLTAKDHPGQLAGVELTEPESDSDSDNDDDIYDNTNGSNTPPSQSALYTSLNSQFSSPTNDPKVKARMTARKAAYHAARSVLEGNDASAWQDLRLRSLGWKGHTEEETIL